MNTDDNNPERSIDEQAGACAALVMDLAPLIMRSMRQELSAQERLDLSVPQFRTLRFVARRPGVSLSDLAEHLGMTLPAASKLLDRLLDMGLVIRAIDPEDRRRAVLTLTESGAAALQAAHAATQTRLANQLSSLTPAQLEQCLQSLTTLRTLFTPTLDQQ